MRILVTNDDGIYSPGIASLAIALRLGEVRATVPDAEQSFIRHATASRCLSCKSSPVPFPGIEAYRINGTLADGISFETPFAGKTDITLTSTIPGYHSGYSIGHSGTPAVAKQVVLPGIKGIALNTVSSSKVPVDFGMLASFAERVFRQLADLPGRGLLNVNFFSRSKGSEMDTAICSVIRRRYSTGCGPDGREHYWLTLVPFEEAEEETDWCAVNEGHASLYYPSSI